MSLLIHIKTNKRTKIFSCTNSLGLTLKVPIFQINHQFEMKVNHLPHLPNLQSHFLHHPLHLLGYREYLQEFRQAPNHLHHPQYDLRAILRVCRQGRQICWWDYDALGRKPARCLSRFQLFLEHIHKSRFWLLQEQQGASWGHIERFAGFHPKRLCSESQLSEFGCSKEKREWWRVWTVYKFWHAIYAKLIAPGSCQRCNNASTDSLK